MAKVIKDIEALKEGARTACKAFIGACKLAGLDVFITETYRSPERQRELYEQGRSKPGKIVTNTLKSNHTNRQAWDISFISTGYNELSKFYKAGEIAEKLNIEWGGLWKSKDRPHFQFLGGVYMLPTAFGEARKLADIAGERGIISNIDLWYSCMTGLKDIEPANLISLFSKITGNPSADPEVLAETAAAKALIINKDLWIKCLYGRQKCTAGNLRALLQKVIAAGN